MVRLYALSLIILAVTVACAESARLGSLRPSDTVVTAEEDAAAFDAVADLEANTAAALTGKASKADLAAEVNRAQAAETALDARLDAAEPAIVAAQADASAALGAAAEAKTAADAAAVKANAAALSAASKADASALAAETARAEAAETENARIAASAADAAHAAQVAADAAAAKAAAAQATASAAVTQEQLQAEVDRATAAEAAIRAVAASAVTSAADAASAAEAAAATASDASSAASAASAEAVSAAADAAERADAAAQTAEQLADEIAKVESYNVTRAEFDPVAQRAYLISGKSPKYKSEWYFASHAVDDETKATIAEMQITGFTAPVSTYSLTDDMVGIVFPGVRVVFPGSPTNRDYTVRFEFWGTNVSAKTFEVVAADVVGAPLALWATRTDIHDGQYFHSYLDVSIFGGAGSSADRPYFVVSDTDTLMTFSSSYVETKGYRPGQTSTTTVDRVTPDFMTIKPTDGESLPGEWYAADPATGDLPLDQLITKAELDDALAEYTPGGGITVETDPTVPAWAKTPEKPTYTAAEVGAQPAGDYIGEDGGTVHGILRLENPRISVDTDADHDIAIVPNAEGGGLQIQFPDGNTAYFAKRTGTVAMVSDIPKDPFGPVWVHPGDWTLGVHPLDDTVVEESATNVSTNVLGQIVGTRSLTVTQGNTVSVSPQPLDQLPTGTAPEALTYTLISGPATLSTDGNAATLTATGDGLARVSATDGTVTRTVMTSFRQDVTDYADVVTYLGDADGTARAGVNDTFLAVLRARDTSVTVPSGVTPAVAACDYLYATKGTAPTAFSPTLPLDPSLCCMVDTMVSQYGQRHFAIAPHFALTAAHWWPGGVGRTGRWLTPDGTVATTTTTGGVRLRDWAIANGYTSEEASAVSDIYVFRTDNAIPDACIPYVIDKPAIDAIFGGSLRGINCYAVTQNGYLTYSYYLSDVGNSWASPGLLTPSSLGLSNLPCRSDIALLLAPSYAAQIYGGDSGMPVFFVYNGQPVVTSLFWTVGSGSSLVTGADILDAYIRQASGGAESLKRITIPSEVNE